MTARAHDPTRCPTCGDRLTDRLLTDDRRPTYCDTCDREIDLDDNDPPAELVTIADEHRWIVRANTPAGHRWLVGQAWSYDGVLGLVERVPLSDAVRVERWAGRVRLTEG